jgi:enamine deaminase RidA (YjgF/YER057c/UK114 family)
MPPKAVTSQTLGPALGMYSHGMVAPAGEIVVVAGQVGTDATGKVVGASDVVAQTRQAFANIEAVLRAAGAGMRDVVRFQTFLVYRSDIDGFMQARGEVFPGHYPDGVYPPNTLLVVSHLVKPEFLVEIEAMAVKPAPTPAPPVATVATTRARPAVAGPSRRRSPARKRS